MGVHYDFGPTKFFARFLPCREEDLAKIEIERDILG
jgi:hypothetical protein